jgi:hypothetical protein
LSTETKTGLILFNCGPTLGFVYADGKDVNLEMVRAGLAEVYRGRAQFDPSELFQHIKSSFRDYIIQGQQECVLAEHTKPHSLDYWLRTNYARTPDTKQATNDVIDQLVETGLFEIDRKLHCPDSGRLCKGIKLKSH